MASGLLDSLGAVDPLQWDACALAPGAGGNPFLSYRFLKALEDSKSVGRRTGWQPQYLLAEDPAGKLRFKAPYRFSAVLVRRGQGWAWRLFHGSAPGKE